MSRKQKNVSIVLDASPVVLTFTLGLLLLSLFIALTANRIPNSTKKVQALRSIAANFRSTTTVKIDQNKFKSLLQSDLSNPGIVKLSGLIKSFFSSDSSLPPTIQEGMSDLAQKISLTNSALEIYCHTAASGVSQLSAYEKLAETEIRCERIADIFRQEGVPNFNLHTRVGFRLTTDDEITFIIRGEAFQSSW